jgi:hypothetical protein
VFMTPEAQFCGIPCGNAKSSALTLRVKQ